jgi:hypothetical protein
VLIPKTSQPFNIKGGSSGLAIGLTLSSAIILSNHKPSVHLIGLNETPDNTSNSLPQQDQSIYGFGYVLCRIVGNELPPRDEPGSKTRVFHHIFNNEFLDPGVGRIWILNRLLDREFRRMIERPIVEAGEPNVILEVDWPLYYSSAFVRKAKLNAVIGINQARNEAFKKARKKARFSFILDGDCYFNESLWKQTIHELEADQRVHPDRKYYAIPMVRVQKDQLENADLGQLPVDEPQLAIRSDATELFDESKPFGQNDKAYFLRKLGLRERDDGSWYALNSEGPCAIVGRVIHLSVGTEELEKDHYLRWLARSDATEALIRKVDIMAEKVILERQGSQEYLRFKIGSAMASALHRARKWLRTSPLRSAITQSVRSRLKKLR